VRSRKGLPISVPETTRAPRAITGGRFHPAAG
jgi:anhydro-N-acetylmuramic acid kinase